MAPKGYGRRNKMTQEKQAVEKFFESILIMKQPEYEVHLIDRAISQEEKETNEG